MSTTYTQKYNTQKKKHNKINYLNIIITRNNNQLQYAVYRKPLTSTNITIPYDSNHPPQHKMAAF